MSEKDANTYKVLVLGISEAGLVIVITNNEEKQLLSSKPYA
jgi:hypothetical protein